MSLASLEPFNTGIWSEEVERDLLLRFSPEEAIVRMFNRVNGTQYPLDLFEVSAPTALGETETKVTLSSKRAASSLDDKPEVFSFEFTYHRLNPHYLTDVLEGWRPVLPGSTEQVLKEITARFNQKFYPEDFAFVDILQGNSDPFTLKAKAESLRWVGEVSFTLLDLVDLETLVANHLPGGVVKQAASQVLYPLSDSVPYLNGSVNVLASDIAGTDPVTRSYVTYLGDPTDVSEAGVNKNLNTLFPAPGKRLTPGQHVWVVSDTPAPFNAKGLTQLPGLPKGGKDLNPLLPTLPSALRFKVDGSLITNFEDGEIEVPFLDQLRAMEALGSPAPESDFNRHPKLTQHGIVSLTNASSYAKELLPFKVGDVLGKDQILPSPFYIEEKIDWGGTEDGPTSLQGAVVQYNGQKRQRDIDPAVRGLDRVLVVSLGESNTAYRGNMSIFYQSYISIPLTLPAATVGSVYYNEVEPVGGAKPYTFTVVKGELPPGLSIKTSGDTLSYRNAPTKAGSYSYTLAISDSEGTTVTFDFVLTVSAVVKPLALKGTFKDGVLGEAYTSFVNIEGGIAPYKNPQVKAGSLPPSIELSVVGSALRLMGTWPNTTVYPITLEVESTDGQKAKTTQQITVMGDVES